MKMDELPLGHRALTGPRYLRLKELLEESHTALNAKKLDRAALLMLELVRLKEAQETEDQDIRDRAKILVEELEKARHAEKTKLDELEAAKAATPAPKTKKKRFCWRGGNGAS